MTDARAADAGGWRNGNARQGRAMIEGTGMNGLLRVLALGAAAIGLSGCLSATPPDTYEISSPTLAQSAPGRTRAQVLIPEPTALKTLDSQNIVVKPTPQSVEFLANSQWSDRLPRMVQLRLLQAFENTGRIGAVGVPGQGLAIDFQLVMEVRKFEIQAEGAPRAVVEISVKALNDRNGSVVRTRVFEASVPASGRANADFVAALDSAFERVSADIVGWALTLF
jgi:cholesterol transport system auxiliary component